MIALDISPLSDLSFGCLNLVCHEISVINSMRASDWEIACLVFRVVRLTFFGKGGHAFFLIRRTEQTMEQTSLEFQSGN